MVIKVASICLTTEKANQGGGIIHQYPYPDADPDEAVALAERRWDLFGPLSNSPPARDYRGSTP